jgi:hypothetical protein
MSRVDPVAGTFAALALASLALGCGDNVVPPEPCTPFDTRGICDAAVNLAFRQGTTVHADQETVSYLYAALKKLYGYDTVFAAMRAMPPSGDRTNSPMVMSTLPAIEHAWSAGIPETGDPRVDDIFLPSRVRQVAAGGGDGAKYGYLVVMRESVNIPRLADAVAAAIPDTTVRVSPPIVAGYDTWPDFYPGGIHVRVAIGWGDCFYTGCSANHLWEFDIPDEGDPVLRREWGAEIPEDVLASYRNYDPPR